MIVVVLGWLLCFVGVVTIDYKTCEFFDILWAFWIQVIGGILYILGDIFKKN